MMNLTPREQEILKLLATTGGTNRQLGQDLGIAERTVKVHMQRIIREMRVTTRAAVVVQAWMRGLVTLEDTIGYHPDEPAPGDRVVFYDGHRILRGTIVRVTQAVESRIVVRSDSGTDYDVPPTSLHRIPREG